LELTINADLALVISVSQDKGLAKLLSRQRLERSAAIERLERFELLGGFL
jgi:hypothetical protein